MQFIDRSLETTALLQNTLDNYYHDRKIVLSKKLTTRKLSQVKKLLNHVCARYHAKMDTNIYE